MLGFDISERTVLRWMRKAPRNPEPAKRWAAFLRNHREAIAAMDFFTVPTLTFGVLYCFFVIAHDRRRILHCNVTKHPNSKLSAFFVRIVIMARHSSIFGCSRFCGCPRIHLAAEYLIKMSRSGLAHMCYKQRA